MNRAARPLVATAAALVLTSSTLPSARAAQVDGPPVEGIPRPCVATHAWPEAAGPEQVRAQLQRNTGITFTGAAWSKPGNRPLVRIVWQTLDALGCTSYLATIKRSNPHFTLNAAPISGWAWGDWGLTRRGAVTVDFAKWQTAYAAGDRGRLVRLLVHEMGHAWSKTPQAAPTYARFAALYARTGKFSTYGNDVNENFSEVVGYYVARCALGNPYDAQRNRGHRFDGYYRLVRHDVFGGREFGPAVGTRPQCGAAASSLAAAPVVRVPKEALDSVRP